ncbi:hypothetical protein BYT27DRAFT_7153412 [Phlegmacium glaucopus]|nr:hypothetical protein BYT27DRAFT_7153412 [Phlegmacium glaucopus]
MGFDFLSHLSSYFSIPPNQITIKELTGGYVNETARAIFTPPVDLSRLGFSRPIRSIICKFAPPFMASNPSQPIDVYRQYAEANALTLLNPESASPLPASSLFKKYPSITIPRLVHHDRSVNVLSMTDLGATTNLDQWLSSEPGPPIQDVERIAATLGQFFAEYYRSTQNPTPEMLERASNKPLLQGWYDAIVTLTKEVIAKEGVADGDVLVGRIEHCYSQYMKAETCIGIVDLWAGNVLIDPIGNPCIVDWEYFGLSSASFELVGLIGSLQMNLLLGKSEIAIKRTQSFIRVFLRNYDRHAPRPSLRFKRQTLIALGIAMLNQSAFFATDLESGAVKRAVHLGLGCLRAAGDSEQEIDTTWFDETLTAYEALFEKVIMVSSAR